MSALTHLPLKHSKSPMQNHVPSNACDVISFYGPRQVCHLTVQGEEIFQTKPERAHFSQEGPDKKGKKKTINIDPKTPMMKMHDKVRKAKEKGRGESEKKSQVCCVCFKLQTLKSCFILRMPKLQCCTQFRRLQSVHKIYSFKTAFW